MKILFDSEMQKTKILKALATSNFCPSDVGIGADGYCASNCTDCWEKVIEHEVKEVQQMNELKALAEQQGGVIYIEQFEEWHEKIVWQLEEMLEDADSERAANREDDFYHNGVAYAFGKALEVIQTS